jgi:hypothetical protein
MSLAIGILVAALLVLAIVIATRPETFRVERTANIAAPAGLIFGYVNDFHQWTRWSPFEGLDPDLKRTYAGAPAGVGAQYSWSGNSKAGEGSMVIRGSRPGERIALGRGLANLKALSESDARRRGAEAQPGNVAARLP